MIEKSYKVRNIGQFNFLMLMVFFGTTLVNLMGCASSGQNFYSENEINDLRQHKMGRWKDDQVRKVADEDIKTKKPPEMTEEDLERLGDTYFSRGNFHMSFVQYEKSLKLSPDNIRVRYKKALVFLYAGLSEDAINEFNEILKRKPDYALAYEGLGQAFFQMKRNKDAEKNFRKTIEFGLDLGRRLWKPHNFLGIIYDQQKKYDLAIQEYANAIFLNPDNGALYHNLGVSYSLAGDYQKAINVFYKAIELKYYSKKTYNNLALALSKLGRYQEAFEAFKNGGDVPQAYNNLGCIYLHEGKFEKAIEYFEKAIETSPSFYTEANKNLKKARMAYLK